jgi:hypothetical protein
MTKYIVAGCVLLVIIGLVGSYLGNLYHSGIQAGIDKQTAADIAKANQEIATRRVTDDKYNKMDAAAVCKQFGLDWVFTDGKSECR